MKRLLPFALAAMFAAACSDDSAPSPAPDPEPELWPEVNMEDATYINNGIVQLGIDLTRGGAVFHFSEVHTKRNLLNHVDEGRFVQQSYYGEPDGSSWNGQPWVWNPVQGGGSNGRDARVLDSKIEATSLYVKSEPVLWASSEPAVGCFMTERITLEGRIAHISYGFSNRGEGATSHPAVQQEMPAVFVDWDLKNYVFYDGDRPWTNDELKSEVPVRLDLGGTNEERNRTEHWAAYVDDKGWGIGVYTPGTELSTTYRFGSGPGGAQMGSCSYFAPLRVFAIEKGMTVTYDVYLMIGTVEEIRAAFYKLREKHPDA